MNFVSQLMRVLSETQRSEASQVKYSEQEPDNAGHSSHTSVDDRTRSEKCEHCGHMSGTCNLLQENFMRSVLESGDVKLWNYPPKPDFGKRPDKGVYCLKKFVHWDPEKLYNLKISGKNCTCGGKYTRKQRSSFRRVEDIESTIYACTVIYGCNKCNKSISAFDERSMIESGLVSGEVYLDCPIRLFKNSCWTSTLLNLMLDLVVSSGCSMKGFINSIARARTSTYLRRKALYVFHCDEFKRQQHVFQDIESSSQFGSYFDHCDAYNDSLFVSVQTGYEVLKEMIKEQEEFLLRYLGGIVGDTLCYDHHHVVPGRVKELDRTTNEAFNPCNGLFGIMSSKNQILSLTYCQTTSENELTKVGEEILTRYKVQNQDLPRLFSDKCCENSSWITRYYKEDDKPCVYLDNFHLLTRYKNALPKTSREKTKKFMQSLSMLLCGSSTPGSKMEAGSIIYSKVNDLITMYQDLESLHDDDEKIISSQLLKVHAKQKRHFENCLPPEDFDHVIEDRNRRQLLRRGTGSLESFWRFLRQRFPQSCASELANSFLLAIVTHWNILREIQFDSRFPYLPISWNQVALSQYLAIKTNGSEFPILPLSLKAPKYACGMTKSFIEASKITPDLKGNDQVCESSLRLPKLAPMNEKHDDQIEQILQECNNMAERLRNTQLEEDSIEIVDCAKSTESDHSEDDSSSGESFLPGRKLQRVTVQKGHYMGSGSRRKKRSFGQRSKKRHGPNKTAKTWKTTLSLLSPFFNSIEIKLLKMLTEKVENEDGVTQSWDTLNPNNYPFKKLTLLWNNIVTAIQGKFSGISDIIRPKKETAIEDKLLDLHFNKKYNFEVNEEINQDGIVSQLGVARVQIGHEIEETIFEHHNVEEHQLEPQQTNETVAEKITEIPNKMFGNGMVLSKDVIKRCLDLVEENSTGNTIRWQTRMFPMWLELYSDLSLRNCHYLKNYYHNRRKAERREMRRNQQTQEHMTTIQQQLDAQNSLQ